MIRHLIARAVDAECRRLTDQLAQARAQRDQARRVAVRWYLISRLGGTR